MAKKKSDDRKAKAQLVAEKAQVSLMTVSRALNGNKGVSEATRSRIKAIAAEIGYQPNSAAQALRKGASDTIAMILDSSMGIRGEFHSDALAGFEKVITEEGFNLLLLVPREEEEGLSDVTNRLVDSTRCCAVAIRADQITPEDLKALGKSEAPIVLFGGLDKKEDLSEVNYSSAEFDNEGGVARAVRHLVSIGHREIAFLGGNVGWIDADQRLKGFLEEMKRQGLTVNDSWVRSCDFATGFDDAQVQLDWIFSSSLPGPSGVICASDKIAAGAIICARKWNKRLPEDLSIVGFDNDSWTNFLSPQLTTIAHEGYLLGKTVGKLILERIENKTEPGQHIVLDTPLVVRDSTAPPARKKVS